VNDITAGASKAAPLTPDICVIGGGAAGLSVVTAAAAFGVPVVLIEREALGGRSGAIATGALIAAGARAQAVREAKRLGISAGEPEVNYGQLHDQIRRMIAAGAPNHSPERLTALGARVIKGEAHFTNRSTVTVGDQAIKARRFVIATGSRPALPPLPGLGSVPYLTEESLVALTRLPERLIVLGGGATGVALAQAMRRLGSTVSLVETGDLLAQDDPEAVAIVRRQLLREGVTMHERSQALRAESRRGGVRLVLAGRDGGPEQVITGTHLLVASGRQADIEALDLELAGLGSDGHGVIVDRGLRAPNRRVFAIGGCAGGAAGGARYEHAANDHAGIVLRNALFRLPIRTNPTAFPRVARCRPELASVGLSEAEARRKAGEIRILRWPFSETGGAQAALDSEGFVKLVTDGKGRILGATIVGSQAGDQIMPWCLALKNRLAAKDMAALVFPSPALAEASGRAALSFHAPLATKPGIRRLIGFLRRFG
jgi:pyruvate/2-oxoglutarate dehydrogenase complex dihydrolipoamide dehydrogenase (E3) component